MTRMRGHFVVVIGAVLALGIGACGGDDEADSGSSGGETTAAAKDTSPIVIGAAVDQTDFMKFFDGPALTAAQIRAEEVNAAGGVNGRKIEFSVQNTQLKPDRTRAAALDLAEKGADILWVTCDVDFSTPSAQVGISKGLLTIAPCIGTDQMGPKRFGEKGKLAFSYGNVAQDEGAALAELAKERGFKTATVVTDKAIAFTTNVCQAFTKRFEKNGGTTTQESFTQGDKTINRVVSKVNRTKSDTIALCTITQNDLPAFVSGVRGGGNKTPIMGPWSIDGAFWLPKSKTVADNILLTTYASVYGDDPDPKVQALIDEMTAKDQAPATGGFVTGAAVIDGIVEAVKKNNGSTDGAKLAATMEGFSGLATLSGSVSFSPEFHTAFGRTYRVIEIKNGKPAYAGEISAGEPEPLS